MKALQIGVCGYSGVGKDTFLSYLFETLKVSKIQYIHNSTGYMIVSELSDFLRSQYGINQMDIERKKEVKDVVRPLLASHAVVKRMSAGKLHYINRSRKIAEDYAKDNSSTGVIVIVTSGIRWCSSVDDEIPYFALGGKDRLLVHLERNGVGPANQYEVDNLQNLSSKLNTIGREFKADILPNYLPVYLSPIFPLGKYMEQVELVYNQINFMIEKA